MIAACDIYDTLHNMLGGKYPHKQLDSMLQSAKLFEPILMVSFGLDRRFGFPFSRSYEFPKASRQPLARSRTLSAFIHLTSIHQLHLKMAVP